MIRVVQGAPDAEVRVGESDIGWNAAFSLSCRGLGGAERPATSGWRT